MLAEMTTGELIGWGIYLAIGIAIIEVFVRLTFSPEERTDYAVRRAQNTYRALVLFWPFVAVYLLGEWFDRSAKRRRK